MDNYSKKDILKGQVGKISMHDVGKSYKPMKLSEPVKGPVKHYPSFSIEAGQAPFLKDYKVGDECLMLVKTKIVGHEKYEHANRDDHDEYRIEIRKIGKPNK